MATKIKNQKHIDPVCGMEASTNGTVSPYVLGSCTYYFCAKGCRDAFVANPDKYLQEKPDQHKGWWTRYLERLSKATGGRAQSCH